MDNRWIISVLVLLMFIAGCAQQGPEPQEIQAPSINSFEECVAAGNPVMESYPRQCNADGQTFVEEIAQQDETADETGSAAADDVQPAQATPAVTYSFQECNYITPEEIEGALGVGYMTGPISAAPPAGCSVVFLATDAKSNFFFVLKDFSGQDQSAETRMTDSECKPIGTSDYLTASFGEEVGEKSCRRTMKTATTQKDIFFVKGDYLVQVGSNLAGVTFEQLVELAELVEPRI